MILSRFALSVSLTQKASLFQYYIWAQVADVPDVKWLHIDLAGPTKNFGLSGRQTGFGVGLMGRLAYKMAQKGHAAPKL